MIRSLFSLKKTFWIIKNTRSQANLEMDVYDVSSSSQNKIGFVYLG